jgi:hypothetical protein
VFDPGWLLNPAKVFPLALARARAGHRRRFWTPGGLLWPRAPHGVFVPR